MYDTFVPRSRYLEPPPRDEITAMYRVVDSDNNGFLAEGEFLHFGQLLFSDDTKPHAVSLVKVGRELTVQLLLLPAACEAVSRYTQVLPIVCHVPTVFFAPAITAAVGAVRTAPPAKQHQYLGAFVIGGGLLVLAT